MPIGLQSTRAKVRDIEKVREVLDSYEVEDVEIKLQERDSGWTLEMSYVERSREDFGSWTGPRAYPRQEVPSEEVPGEAQDPDPQDRPEREFEDEYEDPEEGNYQFVNLLADLGPYLESPLVVLVVGATYCHGSPDEASAWVVGPGIETSNLVSVC